MVFENTRYMQYVAATTGALAIATLALYGSWSSPNLPKIAAGNSPLGNITKGQSSWIVSSLALGQIPGSLISGWTLETFGRRGSLLLSGFPILLPWFIIAFSSSVWMICVARFIAGVALANACSAVMLYNGETAEKEIRGRIGASFNTLALVGELIMYCIGPYVSYTAIALISSTVPLLFITVFYFMPESPHYLIKIGKEHEAKLNLKRLLKSNTTQEELESHLRMIKESVHEETVKETSIWQFLTGKEYRKSLLISLGIQVLHQLSGITAILSYMQSIIQSSKSSISPETSSMICGLVQCPLVLVAGAIVDKAGRKPLLIISALGCGVALILEGIYFYLLDVVHADVSDISWMPTFGIMFYLVMRPIGLGTLTFVLMGELFATNIKGHAIAFSTFANTVLGFLVAKNFELLASAWGKHSIFAFFSMVCILGAAFVYFVVPETKGKTFTEIKEKLNRKYIYKSVSKPV